MKFFKLMKDGGPESRVYGYFLFEIKWLGAVSLLHFHDGARDSYHTHAFNAVSWILKGKLFEVEISDALGNRRVNIHRAGFRPVVTPRRMFHKVVSDGDTWALTFRGPWVDKWKEFLPKTREFITLTHGRRIVPEAA